MIAQSVRNATTPDSLRLASNRILALVEDWEGAIVIKHHLHASPRSTIDQVFGVGEVKSTSREEHGNPDGHPSEIEVTYD